MPDAFGTLVHMVDMTELVFEYVNAKSNPIGIPVAPIVVMILVTGLGIVVQLVTLGLATVLHTVVINSSRIVVMERAR